MDRMSEPLPRLPYYLTPFSVREYGQQGAAAANARAEAAEAREAKLRQLLMASNWAAYEIDAALAAKD